MAPEVLAAEVDPVPMLLVAVTLTSTSVSYARLNDPEVRSAIGTMQVLEVTMDAPLQSVCVNQVLELVLISTR